MSQMHKQHPSSYRDPSGFIFETEGVLYRQVNLSYKDEYDFFVASGCYDKLVAKKFLVPHQRIDENKTGFPEWYTTLKPELIPFISYPYEWSFSMLKDAALLTLKILKEALAFDIVLKDATPFNVQWKDGSMIFIDSLSFEKFQNKPWIAYRQFCENFLAPLLLSHYKKEPLQSLLLAWPEGIPLSITKSLLPWRSRFSIHTYLHIHLHAGIAKKKKQENKVEHSFSKKKLLNLITSLETLITSLRLPDTSSTWSDYYTEAAQRNNYLEEKKTILQKWLSQESSISTAIDAGANAGEFSKLLAQKNIFTIATDFDPYCINTLYKETRATKVNNILPLILDLSNPSPAIGVNHHERASFLERANADLVLCLAVIHHLTIGKNIPFEKVAYLLGTLGKNLIIEFVPKEDEKVQLLLASKKDIYTTYSKEDFVRVFSNYYNIDKEEKIADSGRALFYMKKK